MASLGHRLAALEQQNSDLSKIKVNKVFCFVCDVASKVPAYDNVPTVDTQRVHIRW